jgi:hypothetical protein
MDGGNERGENGELKKEGMGGGIIDGKGEGRV